MHLLMSAQFFCKDNRAGCPHASEPQVYAGRQGVCKAVSETLKGCPGASRASSWLRLTSLLWVFFSALLYADLIAATVVDTSISPLALSQSMLPSAVVMLWRALRCRRSCWKSVPIWAAPARQHTSKPQGLSGGRPWRAWRPSRCPRRTAPRPAAWRRCGWRTLRRCPGAGTLGAQLGL